MFFFQIQKIKKKCYIKFGKKKFLEKIKKNFLVLNLKIKNISKNFYIKFQKQENCI